MNDYEKIQHALREKPHRWLITGAAGFIGSNLLETLLKLDQRVTGLDNFATGHRKNLDEVRLTVSPEQWARFDFVEGDIRNLSTCKEVCSGVEIVLHQAALGSVPRSIEDPITTNEANVSGFLNMLVASRDAQVGRFVYAASSSTYGDHPDLPKVEDQIGNPLSPYAVTKLANELYANVFAKTYGMQLIGLRYFNVFGKRQDPNGAYAAVVPRWFAGFIQGDEVMINGDGETSRDFCYIDNCVQANLLAASTTNEVAIGEVYNVAYGQQTTLNELFFLIRDTLLRRDPDLAELTPNYREFRSGDVRHSLADIRKARRLLGYAPLFTVAQGLQAAVDWYLTVGEEHDR